VRQHASCSSCCLLATLRPAGPAPRAPPPAAHCTTTRDTHLVGEVVALRGELADVVPRRGQLARRERVPLLQLAHLKPAGGAHAATTRTHTRGSACVGTDAGACGLRAAMHTATCPARIHAPHPAHLSASSSICLLFLPFLANMPLSVPRLLSLSSVPASHTEPLS
jgi:hypothetical protein